MKGKTEGNASSRRENGVRMGGMRYPPDRRSFLIAGGLTALADE